MTVRAKFFVKAITYFHDGIPKADQAGEVTLGPVYGSYPGSKEGDNNESWSKWTPSGEIKMTITNPAALAQFELGKAYYIDFTPVG